MFHLQSLFPNLHVGAIEQWLMKEKNILKIPKKGKHAIRQMLKQHFHIVINESTTIDRNRIPSLPDKVQFPRTRKLQLLEDEDDDDLLSFWLD